MLYWTVTTQKYLQEMYGQWAQTSTTQWDELTRDVPPPDMEAISRTGKGKDWRGQTHSGQKWGGWIQELGDVSPMQSLIIATAKPQSADQYILHAQKRLALVNLSMLKRYAKLTGTTLSADNSIRICENVPVTQEDLEHQQQHQTQLQQELHIRRQQSSSEPSTSSTDGLHIPQSDFPVGCTLVSPRRRNQSELLKQHGGGTGYSSASRQIFQFSYHCS